MNEANDGAVVGLRVDVDTFRGTRDGVPKLLALLAWKNIHASFFFSVGPDNMGRHLWRLFKPAFLAKMIRSRASQLYGWDILLRGTLWRGPLIGRRWQSIIRETADAGHEIGLHAWDHHRWQERVERMSRRQIRAELDKGLKALSRILGRPVHCSAAPGWKCTEEVLLEKQSLGFLYNSDCRGAHIFCPVVEGAHLTPQIPVTLPTYDEVIARHDISDSNYNRYLLSLIRSRSLNVLAVHAEVEGIARAKLFAELLETACRSRVRFVPLGSLLRDSVRTPDGAIAMAPIHGREGTVCRQVA